MFSFTIKVPNTLFDDNDNEITDISSYNNDVMLYGSWDNWTVPIMVSPNMDININNRLFFIEYKFKSNNKWFYDNNTKLKSSPYNYYTTVKNNVINIFDEIYDPYMYGFCRRINDIDYIKENKYDISYAQYDTYYYDDPIQLINILNNNINSELVIKICSILLYYSYNLIDDLMKKINPNIHNIVFYHFIRCANIRFSWSRNTIENKTARGEINGDIEQNSDENGIHNPCVEYLPRHDAFRICDLERRFHDDLTSRLHEISEDELDMVDIVYNKQRRHVYKIEQIYDI